MTNTLDLWGLAEQKSQSPASAQQASPSALIDEPGSEFGDKTKSATTQLGRVLRVDRGQCDVITNQGKMRVISDSVRAQDDKTPVTGDWGEIQQRAGLGAVFSNILERRTLVKRNDPTQKGAEQLIAANADLVGVVHGLDQPLVESHLERLLVVAINSGATPLVILTKADLASKHDQATVRALVQDINVIVTSTISRQGLSELVGHIGFGRTLALIGSSGAGKSALANALVGQELQEVGAVRQGDNRGRHITSARQLLLLPNKAGMVLDTPGIRSVGLWEAEHALELVFGDLQTLSGDCRFSDCTHRREPACAVQAAANAGTVDAKRVARYVNLVAELAHNRQLR